VKAGATVKFKASPSLKEAAFAGLKKAKRKAARGWLRARQMRHAVRLLHPVGGGGPLGADSVGCKVVPTEANYLQHTADGPRV